MDSSPSFLQTHITPQKPEWQLSYMNVKLTDEHNNSGRCEITGCDSLSEDIRTYFSLEKDICVTCQKICNH